MRSVPLELCFLFQLVFSLFFSFVLSSLSDSRVEIELLYEASRYIALDIARDTINIESAVLEALSLSLSPSPSQSQSAFDRST